MKHLLERLLPINPIKGYRLPETKIKTVLPDKKLSFNSWITGIYKQIDKR